MAFPWLFYGDTEGMGVFPAPLALPEEEQGKCEEPLNNPGKSLLFFPSGCKIP